MSFLYIKIPVSRRSSETVRRIDHGIEDYLMQHGEGKVIGTGTSVSDVGTDASRPESFHRIDIETVDGRRGIALMKALLVKLHAPSGTEIHFTEDRTRGSTVLGVRDWIAEHT